MDRRDFMKASGAILAGASVGGSMLAEAQSPNTQGRIVLAMNRGWRYSPKFVEGAHDAAFDDSNFDRVVVPHTNVKLPWHGFDDKVNIGEVFHLRRRP